MEDMMKRVLVVLLVLWAGSPALAESPVYFADANLKAAVEQELWTSDPTPTDMLGLTHLYIGAMDITSLTGLEYASNLDTLTCSHNWVSDLTPLAGLTNLRVLAFNQNQISDLTPLSGLINLQDLNIHDNDISDISPLSGLHSLIAVDLHSNRISSLSALAGLNNLETLILDGNLISDLSPLAGLSCLNLLRLGVNHISDVSPLSGLSALRTLWLGANDIVDISSLGVLTGLQSLVISGNQISDISPLTNLHSLDYLYVVNNPLNADACAIYMPQILAANPDVYMPENPCASATYRVSIRATAGGSVISPGEGQFTYEAGAVLRVEARADPGFLFAGFSGTYATGSNPAFITVDRNLEIQANFVGALDEIHVDDDAPGDPSPGDAQVSDPQEDGTREHPFDRIQEAIEVSHTGVTVFVHGGTYRETIDLLGKNIRLRGFDSHDSNGADWPIIDGGGAGPVVSFTRWEGPDCRLTGLVITGGKARSGSAIFCSGSSPTIVNCLIAGNCATDPTGSAIYCGDSAAAFVNCTITDNDGGSQGAGLSLMNSPVTLVSSILWGNTPRDMISPGEGSPSIHYSDVPGSDPGLGNIDTDPLFARMGYWADRNRPGIVVEPDFLDAVWVAGDYHLRSQAGRWDPKTGSWIVDDATSRCIDGGDPTAAVGPEPSPNGGIVNMGVYGGTTEASKSVW
jgi:hypothetical protein